MRSSTSVVATGNNRPPVIACCRHTGAQALQCSADFFPLNSGRWTPPRSRHQPARICCRAGSRAATPTHQNQQQAIDFLQLSPKQHACCYSPLWARSNRSVWSASEAEDVPLRPDWDHQSLQYEPPWRACWKEFAYAIRSKYRHVCIHVRCHRHAIGLPRQHFRGHDTGTDHLYGWTTQLPMCGRYDL